MNKTSLLILIAMLFSAVHCRAADSLLRGHVSDAESGEPLPFAAVLLMPGHKGTTTDEAGNFSLHVPAGKYTLKASYAGYDEKSVAVNTATSGRIEIKLQPKVSQLREVTVTARESDGLTSSSRINRDAMDHLQPTSFTDLLELLPGNISHNPEMGKANTIGLRETGNLSATGSKSDNDDYAISSLGTLFMVDGAPINGDANLQGIGTGGDAAADARSVTNKGVDMRTISTDNIQSVEIVRGIPSAEYGNLTSGVVKIKRISHSTPLAFRFKADEYSKLFSIGKGFGLGQSPFVINADLSYLDSRSDPRNNLENYKRLTGSLRLTIKKKGDAFSANFNVGADYTGSFDNAKSDPDLSLLKVDEYKSSYNRLAMTTDWNLLSHSNFFFNDFNVNASGSYQIDRLQRRKQVAPQRASVAPTTMKPGESVGQYLLGEYIADFESDGRPLNIFLKARAAGNRPTGNFIHSYKLGGEWTLSKNYGRGQVYDLTKPISASWTTRPQAFRDIPALHVLSFFVEDLAMLSLPGADLNLQAGLRTIQLPALDRHYWLAGRVYLDPRINASVDFKLSRGKGSPAVLTLAGGYGLTTKMPTIDYLYPQAHYNDIIQLNYYDAANPREHSLISLRTYVEDATNYQLRAARNHKWEVRIALSWKECRLSVTYFQERMNDGFRYQAVYASYPYKKYDASAIDAGNLTAPPLLDKIPYMETRILDGYRQATNGTRIDKQGIEWQINTARCKPLCTSLIITGAWFRSIYSNSSTLYSTVSDVYDGAAVSDRYVGLYNYTDGRRNVQVNTNFMFDTQIPRWGLLVTTTLQCMWMVKTTRLPLDGVPISYLDALDGALHPYISSDEMDPALRYLVKTYNADSFRPVKIPFAGYLNIKATKTLGKHFRIALFVNRIFDWLPSYRSNGLLVRRSTSPYFGMEVNVNI